MAHPPRLVHRNHRLAQPISVFLLRTRGLAAVHAYRDSALRLKQKAAILLARYPGQFDAPLLPPD